MLYSHGNDLLDSLRGNDRAELVRDLRVVPLAARAWLAPYGGPLHHVDFPIDAVISIVATLRSGDAVEVGSVGREGFVETDVALECDSVHRNSFCHISGDVARIALPRFRTHMERSPAFARTIRRSVTAMLFHAQQFAACNARHGTRNRLARWLLATRDRVGSDAFPMTHEAIATMLGVRRATITEAAQALQSENAILCGHGHVRVTDAALLAGAACECYEACRDASLEALRDPRLTA